MATINGVEVIGDKSAHDFDLLDKNDGINLANGIETNRKSAEDNHSDIVRHRTDTDVHVTPEWKNSLVTKAILGLYWTAAQTADIINEISIAGGAKLLKVDTLPAVGLEQTIYLVPKADPQAGDVFDEYVWIDNKFEFIGTTKANLSNYYTKVEIDYIVSQLDYKYVKSDDTTLVKLTNLNEINLQEDHYNAWLGYRGGKVTNWKFGDGTEGGYANVWANDYYLNGEKLSDILGDKANDADVVHKTNDETIDGEKTFLKNISISADSPYLRYYTTGYIKGVAPASITYQGIRFYDDPSSTVSNHIVGGFEMVLDNDGYNRAFIGCRNYAETSQLNYAVFLRVPNDTSRSIDFCPSADNVINLGTAYNRWKNVNAALVNGETVVTPTYLEAKAEEWEFTLSDGSTVTKKIVMA